MAANNGGGGRQNGQMNEHVEFSVKAEEDLYLTGSENTIRRVTAETNYSCLMLKTQRFSSLFRHYAKYHGLRKDDLEYYFVNLLENEDTPESVQLQRGDTIMVRKRRKPELPEPAADDEEFFKDMRELLADEEHMDCVFQVHASPADPGKNGDDKSGNEMDTSSSDAPNMIEIRAHKCILTARADYFKALFRTNNNNPKKESAKPGTTFKESALCACQVEQIFTAEHVHYVLEFVYTNRIADLRSISTDDLLLLLHLADKWLLRDLKRLVEHELIREHISVHTVARLYGATEDFHASRLSQSCIDFIMNNLRQLAGNSDFEEEMKNYPHLCIPVLKAAADLIPNQHNSHHGHHHGPQHKKQRTDHHASASSAAGTPSSAAAAAAGQHSSSPVPDLDT